MKAKPKLAERVEAYILRHCGTYGQMEQAAGVADRITFWRGKNEDQARAALREMIAGRIQRGELTD